MCSQLLPMNCLRPTLMAVTTKARLLLWATGTKDTSSVPSRLRFERDLGQKGWEGHGQSVRGVA